MLRRRQRRRPPKTTAFGSSRSYMIFAMYPSSWTSSGISLSTSVTGDPRHHRTEELIIMCRNAAVVRPRSTAARRLRWDPEAEATRGLRMLAASMETMWAELWRDLELTSRNREQQETVEWTACAPASRMCCSATDPPETHGVTVRRTTAVLHRRALSEVGPELRYVIMGMRLESSSGLRLRRERRKLEALVQLPERTSSADAPAATRERAFLSP